MRAPDLSRLREAPSPLTDGLASYRVFGFVESPPAWYEVREADGLTYVASARWVAGALAAPRPEEERRGTLLAARHFRRAGTRAAFFGVPDRAAWDRDRLPALFGPLEPWIVRG